MFRATWFRGICVKSISWEKWVSVSLNRGMCHIPSRTGVKVHWHPRRSIPERFATFKKAIRHNSLRSAFGTYSVCFLIYAARSTMKQLSIFQ